MAEPLSFDIEFNAANSAAEAEQALQGIQDSADAVGRSISDAFDSAQQIVTTLASASVGNLEQLTLFGDAAQNADQLASGLTAAADAGQNAAQAAVDVAAGMADAGAASGDLAAGADAAAAAAEATAAAQVQVSESVQQTTESQRQQTEETSKGVDLAGRLSDEFERVAGKVGELAGPMSRFTDEALAAVAGLEGISGLATAGLAAGAVGLLAAGESFHNASVTITQATGATGGALAGLQDSFKTALEGSGRSAGDLAQILGTLNRDTGLAGDALAGATDQTAKFLKVTNGSVDDVRGLTQALRALGGDATDLSGFEDQLATVTTHFGISLSSLVQQIKTAGPALATLGFDRGQVAGLVGELDQAGLSVQRIVPGLTKLSDSASKEGKTAADAFGDLITKIKGASDSQAALNDVQGVFSGRVAAQFVEAVRNGTVDIGKLNAIMAESPGTVNRLGDSVKGLSAQFGLIKNDILATFGEQGLPLLDSLRAGIEDLRPFMHELFQVLGDLSPAFKGFATAAFLPVEALRLLQPPLQLIDDVLSHIPAPLLEAVGAFAAFQLLPFGAIGGAVSGLAQSLVGFATAAEVAVQEEGVIGALGSGIGALGGPITLGATAALAGLFFVMQRHQKDAEELKARADAVAQALGDMGTSADIAGPKLEALLQKGSAGKIISDDQLKALGQLGISLGEIQGLAGALSSGDQAGVKKFTDEISALLAAGVATNKGIQDTGGFGLSQIDPRAAAASGAIKNLNSAVNQQAAAQLDQLTIQGKITVADRQAAAAKLGLKDETEGEARTRDLVVTKLNQETAAKAGLATGNAAEDASRGAILNGLEKEGGLRDQINVTTKQHAGLLNDLAAASRNGLASNEDRIKITEKLVAAGLSSDDATKEVTKSEKELMDLQAKHTPVTREFNDAIRNTFEQIGHGTGEWQALTGASQTFGVSVADLAPEFDKLNSQLQKFAPPIKVGNDVMSHLISDMQAGLPVQTTFKDLMVVTGDNTDVAFAALDQYKKGVDDTTKAVDGLVPSLGSVISKLEDQGALAAITGPDAAAQAGAISDAALARKADLQSQIDDLNAAKTARSDADQASIDAQKKALQDQKSLDQAAAKARGETFNSDAIDLQIQGLKARTDTSDLDAQITALQSKQKDVDAGLARSQAALKVFSDEEQAIRANANLRDSDLLGQIKALQQAKDTAAATAAARGEAFDPGPIEQKIAKLQAQRDQIAAVTDQSVADAQAASGRVQQAVTDAQGGVLDFGAVLDTFNAQITQKLNDAQIISQLEGQKFGDIVKFLFDPQAGLSDSERSQRLAAIATLSPEERAAFEQRSKAALDAEAAAQKATGDLGDIFANANPAAVQHATDRGNDLAKGIADGFVKTLNDSKINEIIDLIIKTGVDPAAARQQVLAQVAAAKAAAAGPAAPSLAGVGSTPAQVDAARQALGVAGTASGQEFLQNAQDAIKAGIPPDAAVAMLAPVQDQLPREGEKGGTTVAHEVDQAIRNSPIPPDAAGALGAGLAQQLPIEGQAGGAGYSGGAVVGIAANPIPTAQGTIMVATVGQALSVAGTDAGANYAIGVAAGIKAKQGDAISATYLLANQVTATGEAVLETASPSKKGIRLGKSYAEGVALGINQNIAQVEAAAFAVGSAVSAPLPPPALVGAGVGAGAAGGDTARFAGNGTATSVQIQNVNVTNPVNGTPEEMAEALSRKIGWLGITGRREL